MADEHDYHPKKGPAVPCDNSVLSPFMTKKENHHVAFVSKTIALPNSERPVKGKVDKSTYCALETISPKHLAWQLAHEQVRPDVEKALTDNAAALGT